MKSYDVIVVGGGASGMMAAGHAAECGREVLLLEKNARLGEKLSITGGGRCNITNAEFDTRTFLSFFGDAGKFLFSPFARFDVQGTFDFFESHGLPLIIEDRGRAFPETLKATDVTRVMNRYVRDNAVTVRTGVDVVRILTGDGRITGVDTSEGVFEAESYILATGGASYKETGSTGEGLRWLSDIGHTVCEATPDIVPLKVSEQWVKDLAGINLEPMKITFTATDGEALVRTGRLLFTHFGLSGPLILNSAHAVKGFLKRGDVAACIDLFPGQEPHDVDRQLLAVFSENPKKNLLNALKHVVPTGMTRALEAHLPELLLETKIHSLTLDERKSVVKTLKALPLTVTGTMGYDWAVVCDGGIDLKEIDTRTMGSRLYPNLFVIGDLLHINRPTGGYSLQLCWTTGWVAGEHA